MKNETTTNAVGQKAIFTPGPWALKQMLPVTVQGIKSSFYSVEVPAAGDGVALCNKEANARLIACAPDMLESLESLTHFIGLACDLMEDSALTDTLVREKEKALELITKAKGDK